MNLSNPIRLFLLLVTVLAGAGYGIAILLGADYLSVGLLIAFGAIGEEIGWRGFLTPELLKQFSFVRATWIGGTIWAVYHFPLLIWIVSPKLGIAVWPLLVTSLIAGIALSFIMNWLRVRSASVWTAVIFHAALNIHIQGLFASVTSPSSSLTHYISNEYGLMVGIVAAIVAFAIWRACDGKIGPSLSPDPTHSP